MFESATIKLTAWYLAIVMAMSLVFSVVIYTISTTEIRVGITSLQRSSQPFYVTNDINLSDVRAIEYEEIEDNLVGSLIVTNICIWILGGFFSYYLAKRTLRPIEEAHEAQSRFTSDASHELRTPLASMKTEIEVALRDPNISKEEMKELLTSNLEEVDTLSKLSHNLLQISRLESDKIARERVKLEPAAQKALKRIGPGAERIKLESNRSYNVIANHLNVEELLTILLDNAIKHSPPDSKIKLKVIKRKSMAGFEVSNKGKGIDPEEMPYIFDRFYQADTARSNHHESRSYGLGLSLAKKIVELHDGELMASSTPDVETKFTVLLPLAQKNSRKKA